jgi:hypothetical protein
LELLENLKSRLILKKLKALSVKDNEWGKLRKRAIDDTAHIRYSLQVLSQA